MMVHYNINNFDPLRHSHDMCLSPECFSDY